MGLRNQHEVKPAYICNGNPVEAAQFYAIACDPKRSVAIEACAGAGKTWMLVSRILRALLDGTKPEAILAITYTKKAAGEMRERLFEWLYSFAQENSHEKLLQELIARGVSENEAPLLLPRLKKLHEELLTHSREVEIRTFHSWFAQLLGAAPLGVLHELGLPVQYELIEDDSELFPQTWQALLKKSLHDSALKEDLHIIMQELGVFSAQEALRAAWGKRVEFMLADAQGVIDSSVRAVSDPSGLLMVSAFVSRWLGYAKVLGEQTAKTPQKAASALEYALTSISSPKERLQTLRDALFIQDEDRLNRYLVKFEVAQQAEMELVELLEQTRQHQAYLYQQRMARLTRVLLTVYAELKREQNIVDMADLERIALRLLGDTETYGWVAQRLDAQIRQVLIDEFQDTNPLQWQALKSWLSAYAGAGGGGRMSIFIVGDPKQSIYRFRRADPAIFMAACNFLQNVLGGSKLACDHTRRNAKEVIQSVNTVFLQAQSKLQYQNFRPHTTAIEETTGLVARLPMVERLPKTKELDQEQDVKWRDSLTEPHRFEEEKLRTKEVYQVAALIEQWVREDEWQPSDIKVLSRKKERLRELLSELNAKRIPWRFADDIHLIETMEVRDIVALLDILASPIHDLLLAQVLRSPIFGLDDRDLMFLAQHVRRLSNEDSNYVTRYWWDVLISAADANDTSESAFEWPKTLIQAGKQLKIWKMLSKNLPPHDLLDRIYHEGNILQRYAITVPAAMRESVIANLNAFLQQALMLDGGRYATPYNLVRAMRRQHIKSEFPETNNAIELLTVHGAKGLEAKGIIILDTDPPSTRTERLSVLMDWPAEKNWPTQFIFYTSQKNLSSNIQYLADQESAANHREELNALYVAMTRAREKLVFSALQSSATTSTTSSWWHRLDNVENVLELEDKTNFFSSHIPYTEKRFFQDLINTGPKASPAAFEPFSQLVLPTYIINKEVEQQHSDIFNVLKAQTGELGVSRNVQTSQLSEQTQAQRFGNAVHRLLELERFDEETLNNIATETGLPILQIAKAAEKAKIMMMHPQTSIFFDSSKIEAVQKEIELFYQNELLRIDRLVKVEGQWWILDYKSSATPDEKFEQTYQQQLAKYKKAIQAIMPREEIHVALITGAGDLIKL